MKTKARAAFHTEDAMKTKARAAFHTEDAMKTKASVNTWASVNKGE